MKNSEGLAAVFESPIGKLGVEANSEFLTGIHFLPESTQTALPSSLLAKEAQQQLLAYFQKKLSYFDLPLQYSSTHFQNKVLKQLSEIPFGKTVTYGELAQSLKTGPRAVGNACRRNPFPIIIPCHRVVARNHIGGYSGALSGKLLDIKTWMLTYEASPK